MNSTKYILTKYERMLRVEKVEYTVEIPETVKYRRAYAARQVIAGNYEDYKIVDIPVSEMLEEEVHSLRRMSELS